jgi:hypothetical protein
VRGSNPDHRQGQGPKAIFLRRFINDKLLPWSLDNSFSLQQGPLQRKLGIKEFCFCFQYLIMGRVISMSDFGRSGIHIPWRCWKRNLT